MVNQKNKQNSTTMIDKLLVTSRVTEIDAVSMGMIGAYNISALNIDFHLETMFNILKNLSSKLTAAINRSKAESTLDVYDAKRDDNIRDFEYLVMGYMHHPDGTIKVAANTVQKVFSKYGLGIIGESYAVESSLIASLINDLSKQQIQDAIAQLPGCGDIITTLAESQNEFEAARIAYEQEKAEEILQLNATEIKKELVGLINDKIVIYLRAMEIVEESTYGNFARTIAEIIAENNEAVKKRRKKEVIPEEI